MKKLMVLCLSALLLAQVACPEMLHNGKRDDSLPVVQREDAYKQMHYLERNFFTLLGFANAFRSCRVNFSAIARNPEFTSLVVASSLSAGLVSWMSLHFGSKADLFFKKCFVNIEFK